MQWYQMFEYAIGHWLQKSTEHVMGCVLCSPGCFSLFRGEALMDDNVMNTYTTVSTEPRHFVQYDQGEDRWLCTLMLQQGWRVEYSAASGNSFFINSRLENSRQEHACFFQTHSLLVQKGLVNFITRDVDGCPQQLPTSWTF